MRSAVCGHVVLMRNRYDGTARWTLFPSIEPALCNNLRIHAKALLGVSSLHGEPGWLYAMEKCYQTKISRESLDLDSLHRQNE